MWGVRGISAGGTTDLGRASTTYDMPSSDAYDGGRAWPDPGRDSSSSLPTVDA